MAGISGCDTIGQVLATWLLTTDDSAARNRLFARLSPLDPVVYAEGLSVTNPRTTVTWQGNVYIARPDRAPFTTGAELDPLQWRMILNNGTGPGGWQPVVAELQAQVDELEQQVSDLGQDIAAAPGTLADLTNGPALDPAAGFPDVPSVENSLGAVDPINRSIGSLTARSKQLREDLEDQAVFEENGAYAVGSTASAIQSRFSGFVSIDKYRPAAGWGVSPANDLAALRQAHASEWAIMYPAGFAVTINDPSGIPVRAGQRIAGPGGYWFGPADAKAEITNLAPGGSVFSLLQAGIAQSQAFELRGMCFVADNPVVLNDKTAPLTNASAIPALMRPIITDNCFRPNTEFAGIGLQMTKCFDMDVRRNVFRKFDVNLLLQGCDIGGVINNRFLDGGSYSILEIGVGSFGSQLKIHDNDLVDMQANGVFIKSNAHHIRIRDNYLEATRACRGFIDLGKYAVPVYSSTATGDTYTAVVHDNRCDGWGYASEFIYAIQPPIADLSLYDTGTTGVVTDASKALVVRGGYLHAHYSANLLARYDIRGQYFGRLNGFKSEGAILQNGQYAELNAKNIGVVRPGSFSADNGNQFIRLNGEAILFLPGTTNQVGLILPSPSDVFSPWGPGNITVEIVARTDSAAGDTLRAAYREVSSGGSLFDFAVTQKYKTFQFNISQSQISTTAVSGVSLARSTQNGNIHIKSIRWVRGRRLYSQQAYAAQSVAAGASVSLPFIIQNADVGAFVRATLSTAIGRLVLTASVQSPSAVTVDLYNPTGATVNVAAGTASFRIEPNVLE